MINTPAFMHREKTTVAVPPPSWPDTVRTSGAAMICWAILGVGDGRIAIPAPKAASATTIAAAAANTAVRQRDRRLAVSGCTAASTVARRCVGGSVAVAAETAVIVSWTARTSLRNASATD